MAGDEIETTERVGQWVYAGTWVGAGIGMLANAGNAVVTFGALGGNRGVGLGIGIAVDVALIVALIGDRHLARHGQRSYWSWALQGYTMLMGLVIAVSAAVGTKHYLLALLLAGVGPLIWLLMGYGQDAFIKFAEIITRLRTERDAPVPVAVADPEPAPVPEYVPWPVRAATVLDKVTTNGHHDNGHRGASGWRFDLPDWVTDPRTPMGRALADSDAQDRDPVLEERVPDVPDIPAPEPGPEDKPVDQDVETGHHDQPEGLDLEQVRQWRENRRAAGETYGWSALREAFPALSERQARSLIADLRRQPTAA